MRTFAWNGLNILALPKYDEKEIVKTDKIPWSHSKTKLVNA